MPLAVSYGVVSLVLTVGLGVVLSVRLDQTIMQRSVRELQKTTTSAIALTANLIVSTASNSPSGRPMTLVQQLTQVALINSAAKVLVTQGDVVGVEVALPDGTVVGGDGAAASGTKVSVDARFRAALGGATQIATLHRAGLSAAIPVEQRLLRRFGDLLVFQQGVRTASGQPVLVVVRAYAPLGPSQRLAGADIRTVGAVLLLGLLVFWTVLFRLVMSASRRLTRQSKANSYLATHDTLTDLPNRALLRDRTQQAIAASRRSGVHIAVILLDLDRFKEVNDTLGHRYGDTLLRLIGPRLREQLRESDTIARLGGDEFVVLLPDLPSAELAVEVAEKLAVSVQRPFMIDGVLVDMGTSVGVATTPEHGDDFDQLLQHADVAMYVAKQDSLGVVVYAPELDSYSPGRLTLLAELRRAVEDPKQIVLHYQPKADLRSGEIVGVEALVRWQHPVRGLVQPDSFIPLAERTGIIRPLTWCILRRALEQNRRWAADGLLLRVAVNISARCLLDVGFPDGVAKLLTESGVPVERLELELTESAIMTDPDRALKILQELAASGIRLSIDDFGTGYSSMSYLKRLPVHEIKIDRTFVTDMAQDASDAAIVRSSLELARNLNLDVVAEGVETAQVWQQLADLGCLSAQGYYLSRPLPPQELVRWLATRAVPVPG